MSLARYKAKRDFRRTREPAGGAARGARADSRGRFVIQKHAARRLHYDFRLEVDGVLKSWAVPKGVPFKKGDKSLAMKVEDHPLEYGDFEGVIPAGNYGAGSVMVWDSGQFESVEGDALSGLKKGKLGLRLKGRKLKGHWSLVRMKGREEADKEPWLLIKSREDVRPVSARANDRSAVSDRTMKQIAGSKRIWNSNRPGTASKSRSSRAATPAGARKKAVPTGPSAAPKYVPPMKARVHEDLPPEAGWIFELKLDGIRAIAVRDGAVVRLFSRTHRDITGDFPGLVQALKQVNARRFVIDGEIVVLDEHGRSSFQLLQNFKRTPLAAPIRYYLFDLVNLAGRDLKKLPLERRKQLLQPLAESAGEPIRFTASLPGAPGAIWQQVCKLGLEGVIAKRSDSHYEPDRRSGAWLKIKTHNQQEFVIGGYTAPQGSRKYFGALLVGFHEKGKLLFASKVGTGYDHKMLKSLYTRFQPLQTDRCPFANLPARRAGRWGGGITASEMKKCTWLKPQLICQIKFMEWTRDGNLRQPVFLGLREDKKPKEVVREVAGYSGGRWS